MAIIPDIEHPFLATRLLRGNQLHKGFCPDEEVGLEMLHSD